ncbi:MAG: NAD-dependent epimerase/dehydratase family protein [Pseudomonadota bacterium]
MSGVDLTDARVAVIGASGFIGQHVVAALLEAGAEVAGFDRALAVCPPHARYTHLQGDAGNPTDVAPALAGADAAICLAPSSLPVTANADFAAEVAGHLAPTIRLAELALAAGCRRFVYASSGGTVYGAPGPGPLAETAATLPQSAYGVTKLAMEHYLRVLGELRGLSALSLRVSNPYGPGQIAAQGQGLVAMAMKRAFEGAPMVIWGDGSVVRDFVYIGDVARAYAVAAAPSGPVGAINVGSGSGLRLIDIAKAVEAAAERPLDLRFTEGRAIDVAANVLDISRAEKLLGWRPTTMLEDGLRQTAAWWRARTIATRH